MITVDNKFGVVSKVTARYAVVRMLDGVEAIVPNETLATTTVLNHSYSNKNVRMAIPIQVSYDSDVEHALTLMAEAARAEPRAMNAPGLPEAFVVRFGDNGIDLELGSVDQRSGERAAQPAQRDQPADLEGVPGQRRPDSVPATGIPAGGRRFRRTWSESCRAGD